MQVHSLIKDFVLANKAVHLRIIVFDDSRKKREKRVLRPVESQTVSRKREMGMRDSDILSDTHVSCQSRWSNKKEGGGLAFFSMISARSSSSSSGEEKETNVARFFNRHQ